MTIITQKLETIAGDYTGCEMQAEINRYKSPLCQKKAVCKVIKRAASPETHEENLFLAIILQAIYDLYPVKNFPIYNGRSISSIQNNAILFFKTGGHKYWCDMIGLNHEYITKLLNDYELLPPE